MSSHEYHTWIAHHDGTCWVCLRPIQRGADSITAFNGAPLHEGCIDRPAYWPSEGAS